jgi:hypothetical protein
MADAVDSPEVPPSDDRILRAWSKVRSSLHESEHRFNSRYAEQYYAGGNADPQEILDYFVTMYEPILRGWDRKARAVSRDLVTCEVPCLPEL